jgi:hypothetical protein
VYVPTYTITPVAGAVSRPHWPVCSYHLARALATLGENVTVEEL